MPEAIHSPITLTWDTVSNLDHPDYPWSDLETPVTGNRDGRTCSPSPARPCGPPDTPYYEWPMPSAEECAEKNRSTTFSFSLLDIWGNLLDIAGVDTYVHRGGKWRLVVDNHAPQASWRRPHNPPRRRAGHAR